MIGKVRLGAGTWQNPFSSGLEMLGRLGHIGQYIKGQSCSDRAIGL